LDEEGEEEKKMLMSCWKMEIKRKTVIKKGG